MLKFSGCSCLTSGRKPNGVLHNATGKLSGQRRHVTGKGHLPSRNSPLLERKAAPQSVNVFQLTGNIKGKPDGQIQPASPIKNRKLS